MSKPLRWTSLCYMALYEAALDQPNPSPALSEAIEQVRQSRDRAVRGFTPEYKEEPNAASQRQQQEGGQREYREASRGRPSEGPSHRDQSIRGWQSIQGEAFTSWLG